MSTPSIDRRAENAKPTRGVLSTPIHGNRVETRAEPLLGRSARVHAEGCRRVGSAGLALLLLALLLIGLGAGAWLFMSGSSSSAPGAPSPIAAGPPASSGPGRAHVGNDSGHLPHDRSGVTGEESARESDGPQAGTRLQGSDAATFEDPNRFTGEGILRGSLLLPEGAQLDGAWTLVVRPSKWLVGAEQAVTRRLEYAADVREFRVEDLPLAGYELNIEADAWTSQPASVLLQRGAPDVFVTVQVERNGTVEGSLFRDGGGAAEGVAARLELLDGGRVFETLVDVTGAFRFEGVPEGNWRLVIGPPNSPLIPARLLEVRRSGVRLPPETLPPLSWFRLVVLSADGDPVVGAEVSGSGNQGGVVRGETNEHGVFVGRDAPAGRWTVRLSHADHGSRRLLFVVRLEEPYEETVALPR